MHAISGAGGVRARAVGLGLLAMLAVWAGWAPVPASAQPWDIAPFVPEGATAPEACPGGGDGVTANDALGVLLRAVGIITGFACDGVPIPDDIVDVAPVLDPGGAGGGIPIPIVVAGGNGIVDAADALVLLRAAVQLVQLVPGGDLAFASSIFTVPSPPFAGSTAEFFADIEGTGETAGFSLCAYGSDPLGPGPPAPLACADVAGFSDAEVRTESVEVPLPPVTGLRTFWMVLDADDEVVETDESNNVVSTSLLVIDPPPPQPDIAFRTFGAVTTSPPVPLPGEPLTIRAFLRNIGTGPVEAPFGVDFFFDPPSPPTVGECGFTVVEVDAGLAPNDSVTVELPTALGGGVAPGPHEIWAVADSGLTVCPPGPSGDIVELNEANNVSFPPLDLCVASGVPGPGDLIDLSADTIDVTFGAGNFQVEGEFSNAGARDVLPFADGFPQPAALVRLTVTVFGSPQPAQLETELSCFVSGAGLRLNFGSTSFPVLGIPGRVELELDPFDDIPESDETNNDLCVLVNGDQTTDPC